MEVNPYSPPQTQVADPPPTSHGLKRRRVLVMILFLIITFGLYYPVWWFRRRPGLNRLNSPKKLAAWPLLVMAALWVFQFGLGLVEGLRPGAEVIGAGGRLFMSIAQLAVGILMIVQSFKIKDMIEDHASPDAESGPMFVDHVQLSGIMTFFFSIFYLQWAINRYVVGTDN
jgi:Domain of unknown function (DUF4234)